MHIFLICHIDATVEGEMKQVSLNCFQSS